MHDLRSLLNCNSLVVKSGPPGHRKPASSFTFILPFHHKCHCYFPLSGTREGVMRTTAYFFFFFFWQRRNHLKACYLVPYMLTFLDKRKNDHLLSCYSSLKIKNSLWPLKAKKPDISDEVLLCHFACLHTAPRNHCLDQSLIPNPPSPLLILQQSGYS